jgi:AcrR family transcriptional regulator
MTTKQARRRPGRPRAFDTNKAVDQAMRLFWRKGYSSTSINDLTKSMRINKPSLYAAFGNKESLFKTAMDRYGDGPTAYQRTALDEPTARQVVEHILLGVINLVTSPANPKGCLWVHGVLSCGDQDHLRRELAKRRAVDVTNLRKRFQRAIDEGDLPADANPRTLVGLVGTVNMGFAVQAAAGAKRPELVRAAKAFLSTWPPPTNHAPPPKV